MCDYKFWFRFQAGIENIHEVIYIKGSRWLTRLARSEQERRKIREICQDNVKKFIFTVAVVIRIMTYSRILDYLKFINYFIKILPNWIKLIVKM